MWMRFEALASDRGLRPFALLTELAQEYVTRRSGARQSRP